jgi:hypothetical protein
MSAPITIVVTASLTHLADTGSGVAWCGKRVDGWPTFALEPGSDMGEGKNDCPKCVAESKRTGLAT